MDPRETLDQLTEWIKRNIDLAGTAKFREAILLHRKLTDLLAR